MTRLRRWWSGVPLVGRLVGIIATLLAAGLILAGVTASTLLESTLVEQVDDKLTTEGHSLAQASLNSPARGQGHLPTDYYGRVTVDGQSEVLFAPRYQTLDELGIPVLPVLTPREAYSRAGAPFTVTSSRGGAGWRAVVFPVARTDGYVTIALPLDDVAETVSSMTWVLVGSGIAIVLIGGAAGWWAVRRSLRPLREIETTAAAIAEGDLSQRIPAAPPSTEVGRLGLALNGMLAQIERAFDVRAASEARMRRFVADASHELRTPLATIRGYGELYRMGALTTKDQLDDTMGRIEGSATRMGGLVEDLLSLARLDERRPLRRDAVDLTVLAGDAVSDLHALDPDRRVTLAPLGAAVGPTLVAGDEPRLRQIVANLVGNVQAHTPAGTPVEVVVGLEERPDESVWGVLEVQDHGPGIDPEHAARVFERFYRVDASRGRGAGGGAGLGMAIVAAIVEAHSGEVGIRQTEGGGTTVRVAIPASPERFEPPTPVHAQGYDGASPSSS